MMRSKQDRPLEAVTYRPAEAAEAIGVGTTMMYDLITGGTVPHVLVGGFIRVPVEALERWAEQIAHSARCAPPRAPRPAKDTPTT